MTSIKSHAPAFNFKGRTLTLAAFMVALMAAVLWVPGNHSSANNAIVVNLEVEQGYESALLTWNDLSKHTDIAGFQYRYHNPNHARGWTDIPNSNRYSTVYKVQGLNPRSNYSFKLRAVDESGKLVGHQSDDIYVDIPDVLNLTGVAGDGHVVLDWTGDSQYEPDRDGAVFWYRVRTGATSTYPEGWKSLDPRKRRIEGLSNGTGYAFQVQEGSRDYANAISNEWVGWPEDTTPPTVDTITITSDAGSDDAYDNDDIIQVRVMFSEPVDVFSFDDDLSHVAELEVLIGATETAFRCGVDQSSDNALNCAHRVRSSYYDADGISIGQNNLTLHDAFIQDYRGNEADLRHDAMPHQGEHKVIVSGETNEGGGGTIDG